MERNNNIFVPIVVDGIDLGYDIQSDKNDWFVKPEISFVRNAKHIHANPMCDEKIGTILIHKSISNFIIDELPSK